jgi:predicted ATPase/DNA-binding XRE family transcriptional regulator
MSPEPGSGPGAPISAFADLLRTLRQARGWTQDELAAKARVGVRTLRDLERGRAKPQRATAELLAGALDLDGPQRVEFILASRRSAGTDLMIQGRGIGLPPPPALIGRDLELAHLDAALRQAALVTLVGVAGVGKTSLGLAAAHRVAPRHPGGVAGIVISEVSTEADILAAVATVFGVPRARDLPGRLAGRPALLLVDAIDRAAEPTGAALRWLQGNLPSLRMLATGRHPSGTGGEYVWPVDPLEPPPPGVTELTDVARYPAARLFLERLREVGETGTPDAAAVAELVRRLGGLPLALELAAARGRILAVPEILDRYGDRILDLADDAATTVRDGIAASYRLLEPAERWALRRLSRFRHRWSVELAEPLLAGGPPGLPQDIVVLLDRLTGLGLVSIRGNSDVRFRLLDVVRDFGREEAEREGEAADAAGRHARVVTGYAARIAADLVGPGQSMAVARLNDVSIDLRAALVWAAEHDPHTALRLASVLPRWWRFRGHDRQGREWLRVLLDHPGTADAEPTVRAWAGLGLAMLAAEHGEGAAELAEVEAALETFRRYGDVIGQLAARTQLCVILQASGDPEVAMEHGKAALALATRYGRTRDAIVAQNNLTWHEIRRGDLAAARRRLTAVSRMAGELGEDRLRALANANLAEVARLDGRYAEAVAAGRRALGQLEEYGDPGHKKRVLGTVGLALARSGRTAEAEAILAELNGEGLAILIEAYLAHGAGDRPGAARRFLAAADALEGQHDARDVVEALVGAIACTDDAHERHRLVTRLGELRRRTGFMLLPADTAWLSR